MSRTEAGLRDWEEVELRVRALARLDRILGKSGVEGSSSNLPFDAPARLSVERERRLFTEALLDGFVLCQCVSFNLFALLVGLLTSFFCIQTHE
jgi:hypothetical protein